MDYIFEGLPCTHSVAIVENDRICRRCKCNMTEEAKQAYSEMISTKYDLQPYIDTEATALTLTAETDEEDNHPSNLEDELNGWVGKLKAVAEEAEGAGFTTVIVVAGYDPISGNSLMGYGYSGDIYAAVGAAQTAADLIKGT